MDFKKQHIAVGIIVLLLEIFFALIYGFKYGYSTLAFSLTEDPLIITFVTILLLVGFGLFSTYVEGSYIFSLLSTMFSLAFTFQFFFICKSFWDYSGLPRNQQDNAFNTGRYTKLGLAKLDNRYINSEIVTVTPVEAIACAIAMWVANLPNLGRISMLQVLIMNFFGIFFYCLNDASFWRHFIIDSGFTLRVFLFGSTAGLVSSFILGNAEHVLNNKNYHSSRTNQYFGLIGSVFVWILLPLLTLSDISLVTTNNYYEYGIINTLLALSASCSAAFATTCLINGRVDCHDIVYASFTGGIAYNMSSHILLNPLAPLILGLIVGSVTTLLTSYVKRKLILSNFVDVGGALFTFFLPSVIGGIYSAIVCAIGERGDPSKPPTANPQALNFNARNRFNQGAHQLAGIFITIAIAAFVGIITGLLFKMTCNQESLETVLVDSNHVTMNERRHGQNVQASKIL